MDGATAIELGPVGDALEADFDPFPEEPQAANARVRAELIASWATVLDIVPPRSYG
jgi:hypothetical protein